MIQLDSRFWQKEIWVYCKNKPNDVPITHGKLLAYDEQFILLEAEGRVYFIPWTEVASVEVPSTSAFHNPKETKEGK